MSFSTFVAGRITFKSKRTFSKLIVRIAIVGIMLGLGVMILSLAIVKGFKREIREKMRGFSGDIIAINFDNNNSYENTPVVIDENFMRAAKDVGALKHIAPFAQKPGIIKANDEIEGVVLKGVDARYDWTFLQNNLVSGRVISFKDTLEAEKQIMISTVIANRLKLKVGDSFLMYFVQQSLGKRKFKIVGIYDAGVDEVNKTYVVGALSLIRKINNWQPNYIGGYEVRVNDFDKVRASNDLLREIMPEKMRSYTLEQNYPIVFEWLKLLDGNTKVVLGLMLIVAVINMISALLIMILERTAMIGMFKAMGATNWRIQGIFMWNALYLIGLGLVLGNLFGVGLGMLQNYTHLFRLDEASYYMKFVPIQLDFWDVVLLNIGTGAISLLVLIIPSMLVSSITPVKAIKFK